MSSLLMRFGAAPLPGFIGLSVGAHLLLLGSVLILSDPAPSDVLDIPSHTTCCWYYPEHTESSAPYVDLDPERLLSAFAERDAVDLAGAIDHADAEVTTTEVITTITARKAKRYGRAEGDDSTRIPEVIKGNPTVCGGCNQAPVIQRGIRTYQHQVQACYEEFPVNRPAGRVVLSFQIDADGSVSNAGIQESSLGNPAIENCIVERTAQWQFPARMTDSLVHVDFPFQLGPTH